MDRLQLIQEVGEEILTLQELKELLARKKHPIAYDGFEPSGQLHIAQGILRSINVNKMLKAGCKFIMWVADWHAWANNKYGGDLEKIQTAGKYFIEVWKASGMSVDKVDFIWCKDFAMDDEYWKKVMQVAQNTTIKRMIRCGQIMGRKEGEVQSTAQILYPAMQCADIFHLNIDICQLGMDQRKVNVLAREIGPKLGWGKPVAVHHHMLMSLLKPETAERGVERSIALKMSKSKPDTAIFMNDSEEEATRKILHAWCPEKQTKENPILEYCKHMVFERQPVLEIQRPAKFGGEIVLHSYAELEKRYGAGEIHPLDLKKAVAKSINTMLEPVRKHFSKGKPKKLFEEVQGFEVTR